MKRFGISAAVILFVATAAIWCGYRLGSAHTASKSLELATSVPTVTLFEELIDRINISYFKADQIAMTEVLARLERQSNEALVSMGFDINMRVSIRNLSDDKVTIVVRNVSLRTLLELICEQTGSQYKVDGQRNEIAFYFNTDIITYGEDDPEDAPEILPPPHLGLPE